MRCERVRPLISAMVDGQAAPGVALHLEGCADCRQFLADIERLRRAVRIESAETLPDLAPRILARLPRRRPTGWLAPAAGALVGLIIGLLVTGGWTGPPPTLAATVPESVMAGQSRVTELFGSFQVVERIRPGVTRMYGGELAFQSTESVSLILTQSSGPPGWLENSTMLIVEDDEALAEGPFPCPSFDGCEGADPFRRLTVGRDPFSVVTPAPLDLVVPVDVFRNSPNPPALPARVIAGREAIGVELTAGQTRPLLDALFGLGNWREIHDTDLVQVWLDREHLVPLALAVFAGQSDDRAVWAARRGYIDPASSSYLELTYTEVGFEGGPAIEVEVEAGDTVMDAGYRPTSMRDAPVSPAMPMVAAGRLEGAVPSDVWAWSDGRAWIRLDGATDWQGPGLFGNLEGVVTPIALPGGTGYRAADGSAIYIHATDQDISISGSVGYEELLELAESLVVAGQPVPAHWPESTAGVIEGVDLVVTDLAGFTTPITKKVGDSVVIDLVGSGSRAARVTQQPGGFLRPPFDPDARAVAVRGTLGRFSPSLGLLEWAEAGVVVSVASSQLSVDELIEIANALERP